MEGIQVIGQLKRLRILLRAEVMFAVLALLTGFIMITKVIPPLWGADETSHFARVYQLSQGHLMAARDKGGMYGGQLPTPIAELTRFVYSDFYDDTRVVSPTRSTELHLVDSKTTYANYEHQHPGASTLPGQFTGAAAYSPLAYIGPLAGVLTARALHFNVGHIITFGRLGGLFVFVALVYVALWLLRDHKIRWLVFVAALLPMSVFQASIITVDSIVIGLAMLIFACLVRLFNKKPPTSRLLLITLFVAACLLAHIKPNYSILLLPIVFLPARIWRSQRAALYYKIALFVVALLLMGAWVIASRHITAAGAISNNQQFANQVVPVEQFKFVVLHPFNFLFSIVQTIYEDHDFFMSMGMFSLLGFTYINTPIIGTIMLSLMLLLATFYGKNRVDKADKVVASWYLAAGVLTTLSIYALFYITFTPVHAALIMGVQGRYFIPVIPFLLYGLRRLLPIVITMSERFTLYLFPLLAALNLVIAFSYYYKVLY